MQRITNNLSLKLISLVLAVLLWSHVRGEVNPLETASVDVPLRIQPPGDIVVMNENSLPEKVTVLLRGPRLSLRNIKGGALANPLASSDQAPNVQNGAVSTALDFSHSRIGEQDVSVKAISKVEDVEVMGVKPANVTVSLDRAQNVGFPVKVQLSPALEEGMTIVRAAASPAEVRVYGPSNTLDEIATVKARINTKALTAGVPKTMQAHLVAQDRHGNNVRGVNLRPDTVTVTVALREQSVTRRLPVAVRTQGTVADGYEVDSVEVTPSSLEVRASAAALKNLDQLDAQIELGGSSDTIRKRMTIDLPAGVQTANEGTPRINVTVRLKKIASPTPNDAANPAPADTPNRADSGDRGRVRVVPRSPDSGRSGATGDDLPPVRHDAD